MIQLLKAFVSVLGPSRVGGPVGVLLSVSLVLGLAGTGCATSTVEKRKQEKYAAFSELTPEQRALVEQGRIKIGMSQDAVYIALGKPAEIVQQESSSGATTHWLYQGSDLQEYRYWNYRHVKVGDRYVTEPYMDTDYYLRPYVRAEVVFENGVVKEWRTLPKPR